MKKSVNKNTRTKTPRTCFTDIFDVLPNELVYNILSRLSMKDISRLSVASKRCRHRCISTFLAFDDTNYRNNASKRAQFINYLERLLVLRQRVNTQCFRICWSLQRSLVGEEYRFLSWLHSVKFDVQQLHLDVILRNGSHFALPSSLFCTVSSLKTLVANFRNGLGILPSSSTPFCSLKCLDLCSVQINESFGKWISSYFKNLKELHLHKIKGTKRIEITSSSLRVLKIFLTNEHSHLQVSAKALKKFGFCWMFDSPDNRELQLDAPHLELMAWLGNISTSRFAGEFTSLKSAMLYFSPRYNDDCSTRGLVNLLGALHNVTDLALDEFPLQVLKQPRLTSQLPTSFPSVLKLLIRTKAINDDLLPAMVPIFERTPNLIHLSINQTYKNANIEEEADTSTYIESSELQNGMAIENLNFVIIDLISQGKNELKLIKYLFKYANNLQKMTLLLHGATLRSDFRREMSQYKKAPNAKVEFSNLRMHFFG